MASASPATVIDVAPDFSSTHGVRSGSVSPAASAVAMDGGTSPGSSLSPAASVISAGSIDSNERERIMQLRQLVLRTAQQGHAATDFEGFRRVDRPGYTQTAPEEDIKKKIFDKLGADFAKPRTRELWFLKGSSGRSRRILNLKVERLVLTILAWSVLLPALTLFHDFLLGPLLIMTAFFSYFQVPFKPFIIFYATAFAVLCLRYFYLDLRLKNCKLLEDACLINCEVVVNFLKRHGVKRCCPFSGEAVMTRYFIIPQGTRNTAKLSVGCRVKEWGLTVRTEIVGNTFNALFTEDGHIEIKDKAGALFAKESFRMRRLAPCTHFSSILEE